MGAWDAVIDVSNVCWDEQLPPRGRRAPVWSRLEMVMAAWRRLHGKPARFDLVADAALARDLDDTREYGRLLQSGELVAVPHADTEILALARDCPVHVITRDRYLQHRSAHPWITDVPDRFHRWRYAGGKVTIEPLGLERYQPPGPSAAGPGVPRHHRLDPGDPRYDDIAATRWQCGGPRCHQGAPLLVVPRVTATGEPRCPACGGPLKNRGQRARVHEIVVADHASGAEITRFVLEAGLAVTVGSDPALKGLNLPACAGPEFRAAVGRIGRRHAELRVEEPRPDLRRLVVTDLWSGAGTTVAHPSGAGFGKPKAVEPGRDTPVMGGGRVILGDAVTLWLPG